MKKLKALDLRIQIAGVAFALVLLLAVGYKLLVSSQNAQAAKIEKQVVAEQGAIVQKRAELRAGLHPPEIQTADIYRLARAMPDTQDMPGIILTLSEVANEAGIQFSLIQPQAAPVAAGSYQSYRINLEFSGDFYGLSDFLYRLRSLVVVHHGELQATGRLFNVEQLSFAIGQKAFPQISASLTVDAYVYGTPGAPAAAPAPTTTTTDSSSSDTSPPSDASAASATP